MVLETVVVAVGPGDAKRVTALADAVADVAEPAGAEVVALHVFESDQFDGIARNLEFAPGEAEPDAVASRHATVRRVVDALADRGVEASTAGDVGDPGETVVTRARTMDADVLVVGGRGRSPTGKVVFGSTAQYVLRRAPCPVLFVRS